MEEKRKPLLEEKKPQVMGVAEPLPEEEKELKEKDKPPTIKRFWVKIRALQLGGMLLGSVNIQIKLIEEIGATEAVKKTILKGLKFVDVHEYRQPRDIT